MEFDPVLLAPRRADSVARGYWLDRTINDDLDACVAFCPDKLALTAVRRNLGDVRAFTYRELAALADRIAVGLARLGVGRNDVVAMQLPNWWQFSLLYLACSRIGAVLNPLMPIFREHELSFMLKCGSQGADRPEGLPSLRPRGDGARPSEGPAGAQSGRCRRGRRSGRLRHPADGAGVGEGAGRDDDPDAESADSRRHYPAPLHLRHDGRTKGRDAFGQHAHGQHRSLRGTTAGRTRRHRADGLADGPPNRLHVRAKPIVLRASAVLLDIWDPIKAWELIRTERATFTMASTPFLTDLTRTAMESGDAVPSLKTFLCAGAPIPGQARAGVGAKIVSAWGMTENGAVTLIKLDDDDRLAFTIDGCALPRRRGEGRRRRRRASASRRVRQAGCALLLEFRRLSQAPAMEQHRRRWLVRHRRPRVHGCERLHPDQRPQQGRHQPRGGGKTGNSTPRRRIATASSRAAVIVTKAGKTIDFTGPDSASKEVKCLVGPD